MSLAANLINTLAKKNNAKKYLEIGVREGYTFFKVNIPHKTAVDPSFSFNPADHNESGTFFQNITSDNFFKKMPQLEVELYKEKINFDIIYIDGLHTYQQSYADFLNSLPYSHDKTIWILDDTVPCDPWSAIPDENKNRQYRKLAGLKVGFWHGDVFKTIFAIHDLQPNFSYMTIVDNGNPQTVLWKTESPRPCHPIFENSESIKSMGYFDMLDHCDILLPEKLSNFQKYLWKKIDYSEHTNNYNLKMIISPVILATHKK